MNTLQQPEELERLVEIYAKREPARVLEIGTHTGGTLNHWCHNGSPQTVVGVDIGEHDNYMKDFVFWKARHSDLHLIRGHSQDSLVISKIWDLGPYDFIFIDGDHTYEGVLRDWQTAVSASAPDAVVAFHDIVAHGGPWEEIAIHELWAEIKGGDHGRCEWEEIIHSLNPEECIFGWPLGIGVVYL